MALAANYSPVSLTFFFVYTGVADGEDFHEFSGAKENLQAIYQFIV
jgi:hypothetical protein